MGGSSEERMPNGINFVLLGPHSVLIRCPSHLRTTGSLEKREVGVAFLNKDRNQVYLASRDKTLRLYLEGQSWGRRV